MTKHSKTRRVSRARASLPVLTWSALSTHERLLAAAGAACSIVALGAMFWPGRPDTSPGDVERRIDAALVELEAIEARWSTGWPTVEPTAARVVRLLKPTDPSLADALAAAVASEPDSARLFRDTRMALEAAREKHSRLHQGSELGLTAR